MEELGKKLQNKLDHKEKNQIFSSEGVLLFGERVPLSELPPYQDLQSRNAFFRAELFAYANPLLQKLATKLGFDTIPLNIRQVKTRRGSCTHDNRIMLNQQLIHLPTRLIQYVIIHEVCHLIEKNHGPHFRKLVSEYCPAFKVLRKELKNQIFLS